MTLGLEHHPAEARVDGQSRQPAPERGEPVRAPLIGQLDRAELLEQGDAVDQFAGQYLEEGRAAYEDGKVLAPLLCLGAIALDGTVSTDEVLAALDGGMTFADAAAKYSVDATLAGNGGVVTVQEADCAGADQYNQQLISDIAAADPEIGEYFVTKLGDFDLVMQLRPYDEISDSAKQQLALPTAQNKARALFDGADVWVSSRYGAWSADQAT